MLKIRVMNISKNELYRHLRLYPNAAWDQSRCSRRSTRGIRPARRTALWLPDRRLQLQPFRQTDVQLLRDSARSQAPRTRRSSPPRTRPMGHGFVERADEFRADLSKLSITPNMRLAVAARFRRCAYLGLCMPRVLSRLPTGRRRNPSKTSASKRHRRNRGEKYA